MKPALILYGTAGSGKTTWIKQEARQRGCRLFRWNVRNDRSLREGREILHAQVRSQERTLIWIEGADDLTQEAQAFLRRVLDTRSPDIYCVLEVRDPSKLSVPVLSRCSFQKVPTEVSYRKQLLEAKALEIGIYKRIQQEEYPSNLTELKAYKLAGKDPNCVLFHLANTRFANKQGREALSRFASGSSAWLQLAWLLSSASESQSERPN